MILSLNLLETSEFVGQGSKEFHFVFLNTTYCWRALARQLPILYNREKKAKSVGCKIGDLRSKFAFNIRGLLNVETCAVDYGCL